MFLFVLVFLQSSHFDWKVNTVNFHMGLLLLGYAYVFLKYLFSENFMKKITSVGTSS